MGLELDLGGSRRISYGSTGMSVTIGIQGIILKLRLSRGGQKFVCPIMLFTHYDWRVALASALLPPLCVSGVKYAIIKPILRHLRDKEKLARRSELMGIVSEGLASAESERRLLEPVAKRKTKKEAERGGLVVVSAVYGTRKGLEIWQAQWAQQQRQGSDAAETPAETLQQWCDVTVATQFLVDGSRLVLHQGVSKAGLMGFHDVAPGENKELWVMYLLDGEPFRSQVGDQQSCRLPRDGAAIEDGAQRGEVMRAAELLGLAPHRAAPA
uniref:DnaJ-like protein C11 C-terminal domain-containing protein n=1 Tax=Tetraselmis chuii TaxID=63592 RepID=A0A7S1SMK2_9CHLO